MIRSAFRAGNAICALTLLACCTLFAGCGAKAVTAVQAKPAASSNADSAASLVVHVRADNAPVLTRECDEGKARSCTWLGRLYGDGVGVPLDASRSCGLYRRACDGADLRGCDLLGGCYQIGQVLAQDLGRAVQLYRRACDGGVANACSSLSMAFSSGEGVEKDGLQAERFARRAVSLDRAGCDSAVAEDCTSLAADYLFGAGIPSDIGRATELADRICRAGHAFGCMILAMASLASKNDEQRLDALRRACDGGLLLGCTALGGLYLQGSEEKRVKGLRLVEAACEQGLGGACTLAGDALCGTGSCAADLAALARRFYEKGCATGFVESCDGLKRIGRPSAAK